MATLTSEAQVANLALGMVGQRQLLDSLNGQSTEALVAKTFFAATRNELLEAWHWTFATKRVGLALVLNADLTLAQRSGWGYCYRAPADMLTPQAIWNGHREPGAGEPIPYKLEADDDDSGLFILTDMQNAELIYTFENKTVALWPASFIAAMAAALAVKFAGHLPVKPELVPGLERSAMLALQRAAARDGNKAQRDPDADSEFIRAR